MIERLPVLAALAVVLFAGGCATQGRAPMAVVTPLATRVVPEERAKRGVVPGKSTKADVIAALGETLVIRFDSGYEVWVYQLDRASPRDEDPVRRFLKRKAKPPADEFVVLFTPSGAVAKTRVRPAPQTGSE